MARNKKNLQTEQSNSVVNSVTFQVAGVFSHGKHAGKTNPKETVDVRLYSRLGPNGPVETVRDIVKRLNAATGGAFYRIINVENVEDVRE